MSELVRIGNRCINLDATEGAVFSEETINGPAYLYMWFMMKDDKLEFDGPEADALWHYLTEIRQGTYTISVAEKACLEAENAKLRRVVDALRTDLAHGPLIHWAEHELGCAPDEWSIALTDALEALEGT